MAKGGKKRTEELVEEAPSLHHDAPAPVPAEQPTSKIDVPVLPKVTVKIAACGLLLENELKRQKDAGLVKQYGQLVLGGMLMQPDEMYCMPRTKAVENAIVDGWIVDMGV